MRESEDRKGFETEIFSRKLGRLGQKARAGVFKILRRGMQTEPGIDGILVTVGLCVIALLLCVVMKDSLQTFIETIVSAMTSEAKDILTGGRP